VAAPLPQRSPPATPYPGIALARRGGQSTVALGAPPLLSCRRAGSTVPAPVPLRVSDDRAGIRLGVEHVTGLGHSKIDHVDGGTAVSAEQRRETFRSEMRRRGLEATVIPGGPSEEDGLRAAHALGNNPPTAVIAFNDRSALGLIEGFRANGLHIPTDVSVLGYDDSQLARLSYVQLSSVSQDAPLPQPSTGPWTG